MSLVVGLGSNLGDRRANLARALGLLQGRLGPARASRVYESAAVDLEDQPPFLNMAAEFRPPPMGPRAALGSLLAVERAMGRERTVPKGPRTIDLDLLFLDDLEVREEGLVVPHPRLFERSFVVRPLADLPCWPPLSRRHRFPDSFGTEAVPVAGAPGAGLQDPDKKASFESLEPLSGDLRLLGP